MRYTFVTMIFLCFLMKGQTQDLEVGLFGGGSYYIGDLNPSGHFQGIQPAYGVLARYSFDDRWAVKLSGYRGTIRGNSENTWFLPDRKLQVTSPVTDISGVAEFNFFPYFTGSRRHFITPYIYAGIGLFFFQPEAGGIHLQPLGTEGQQAGYEGRKPYSLVHLNFPFGLGVKIGISRKIGMTVFWEMHKTLTDYLDDVSTTYYLDAVSIDPDDPAQYLSDPALSHRPGMQRGNSRNQDWYSFSGIAITYKFAVSTTRRCRDVYD